VNSRFEAADRAQIERQEIEEQGSLGFCGERDHLALLLFCGLLVNNLQVRGFAAQPGAVVHDFAIDLAGCEVDETQDFPQSRGSARLPRAKNIPIGASGFYITRAGFEAGYSGDSVAAVCATSLQN
jgi:hypothetical protein